MLEANESIKRHLNPQSLIYDKLQDEESRRIYQARLEYLFDGDEAQYFEQVARLHDDWRASAKVDACKKAEHVVLCGLGGDSILIRRHLSLYHVHVTAYCDNNKVLHGTQIADTAVLPVGEAAKRYPQAKFILATHRFAGALRAQLQGYGIPDENLVYFDTNELLGIRGHQYFDVYPSSENESFVDGGGFDGLSTQEFIQWAKSYRRAWIFEPLADMAQVIENRFRDHPKVQLIRAATWDKEMTLRFTNQSFGSHVAGDDVPTEAATAKIDDIVGDERVTFLKLDVEGSEYESLLGAANVIRRDKPRMAICLYHKPGDVLVLPNLILSMVPEYKFYLRHYFTDMRETVLYANV